MQVALYIIELLVIKDLISLWLTLEAVKPKFYSLSFQTMFA